MLPTFVIGLREGLEAALIVGIIAAFLGQQGRRDALRQVWVGTATAVAICIAIAIALQVISSDLPQQQQEGLETVVGALAVVMVTYMIIFMRRHARGLKGDLEGAAASALASGSSRALVAMAFLAVLREGFETAVFLLATFHASGDATTSWLGAVIGILLAAAIGYGIYRGGVRLNLARFFKITAHGPGAGRRGPGDDGVPHRQRGRLADGRAGPGRRPVLAGPAGHPGVLPADRRARDPALSGVDRGHRLARVPGPDGRDRGLAFRPQAPQPGRRQRGGRGYVNDNHELRSPQREHRG